jgi:hypothetical protein
VPYGVLLNFSDYDVRPPSVRLVNPFTRAPLAMSEIPYHFPRLIKYVNPDTGGEEQRVQPMVVAFKQETPFLCLPGVREYHDSSAHSGDPWLLHRGTGEGTLHFLLETLCKYGAEPLRQLNFKVNMSFGGFVTELPT